MKRRLFLPVCLAVLLLASLVGVGAEEVEMDPLLRLLVEQGLISQEQAEAVQAEYDRRRRGGTPAEAAEPAPAPVTEAVPQAGPELPKYLKHLKVGTLSYVSYQAYSSSAEDHNRFLLKRGYLDIRNRVNDTFGFRITPDIHQDEAGDFKVRMKYLYGDIRWAGGSVISRPHVEAGIAHMPWLDFEEHINRYRMQDTMFLERNGIFNSADVGVLFGANLGRDMPEDYRKHVSSHFAGRYGSFQVGVYNGGGYHASERNDNKVIEGRLTLRPLPDIIPGLQLSVLGLSGEGNVDDDVVGELPDWDVLNVMLSYESRYLVATGQYYQGVGNQKGTAVGPDGRALDQSGYSLFAELRCPSHEQYSLIVRHDSFDTNTDDPSADVRERWIAGVAWQFLEGNYVLLDYDRLEHSAPSLDAVDRYQLTLQIKY